MLDIIFLSYDEPNADANWEILKARFPHARRVHGVDGIQAAHLAASKKASTTFFYVVDGDAEIAPDFDFSYKPTQHEANYVHIWPSYNPAVRLLYGYGGVKLFSKKFFTNLSDKLDFSTTLTKDVKYMDELSCITRFNSDPLHAHRGAFREATKLSLLAMNGDEGQRQEAWGRLVMWLNPDSAADHRRYIVEGATEGMLAAWHHANPVYINDFQQISSVELSVPQAADLKENPMKHELFFISRISSALYDPFVLANLPITELRDALSDGQLLSKVWAVRELKTLLDDGRVPLAGAKPRIVVTGGWIGTFALMLRAWEIDASVMSIDLDTRANQIAHTLNYDHDFMTAAADAYEFDYSAYDVIINTSSEHFKDIAKWRKYLPSGKLVLVQNNDFYDGDGHVSNVRSLVELQELLDLKAVLYKAEHKFPQYTRYMVIGIT